MCLKKVKLYHVVNTAIKGLHLLSDYTQAYKTTRYQRDKDPDNGQKTLEPRAYLEVYDSFDA